MKKPWHNFRVWLRRQPENRILGVRADVCLNPISLFLREKTGTEFCIAGHVIWPQGKPNIVAPSLPEWVAKLDVLLDEGQPGKGIQARTVKKLLNQLAKEMRKTK